ncbi:LacI family DNA-binding transcriptional regulator [Salibaculum griseiflavum]|uniref:LacI family transcriptional regulator n=1 Tax=Salibaculum griseiflavum TaxID=1914409 RepID=A0A2V1P570_9RHOB|nr:LacI family DNA-binding transcriptional regulator [Salibaculum griseiflavum]PWG16970.1 LacI family transcriptional regulator [Salibaculum griseiflavum]
MSKRPTIKDLAREAGVGVATVDRVLHGRANVSPATVQRVAEAAERIGYHAAGLIPEHRTRRDRQLRLGFVLHKHGQEFYRSFAAEIDRAAKAVPGYDLRIKIEACASQSPEDFAQAFTRAAESADAVAGPAINHAIVDRCIAEIAAGGTPCFALLNDFARDVRLGYFGLDNMQVGRIAGWMIATRMGQQGKAAVFVGGNRWHGHVLRETGFRSYLREYAPGIEVLDTIVNLETRQVTYEATLDLLDRHPDLGAIFVAGGGMEGAIRALREMRPPGKVALVVPELTEDTRRALTDRYAVMAIGTPLGPLCRDLIAAMITAAETGRIPGPDRVFLQPQIYVPEAV